MIDKIKDYSISLPVVFDFESWDNFSTLNLSLHDINEISKAFLSTIKVNEYDAMNYSSKYYLESIWDIDEYPVWLAHYISQTNYNGNVDIDILNDFDVIKN